MDFKTRFVFTTLQIVKKAIPISFISLYGFQKLPNELANFSLEFYKLVNFCRSYIQRAFQACTNEAEKDKTEAFLKTVLNDRMKDGSAFKIDWEKEPLPV